MNIVGFKYNKNTEGFSLIEIIVYLAIFSFLSILVIRSFITILASSSVINTNYRLLDSGSVAIDRISYEIRRAKSVDLSNSYFSVDDGAIRLKDENDSSYVDFLKSDDALIFSKNGTVVDNLLSNDIILNKLIFNRIVTVNGEALKIEMEIQDKKSDPIRKEKFYDTIILRGGYK